MGFCAPQLYLPMEGYPVNKADLIETVAKNEYRETLRQLLAASEGTEELEEKVELLRIFLETMDFKKLRRESEKHLLQGSKVTFVVYGEGGTAKYDLRVE